MLFKESNYNPLPELLSLIGNSGIVVSEFNIIEIAKIFAKGGVIMETEKELFKILNLFIESYGLLEFKEVDSIKYLKKVNNG